MRDVGPGLLLVTDLLVIALVPCLVVGTLVHLLARGRGRHARTSRRKAWKARALRLAVAVPLVAIGLGAWLGSQAVGAHRDLEQARSALAAARVALLDRRVPDAEQASRSASRATAAARHRTDDPVWQAASAVPVLGRSLTATRGVTAAVDVVARRVLPPGLAAAEALSGTNLRLPGGGVDLGLVAAARPDVTQARAGLHDVDDRLAALPRAGVLGPVRRAQRDLQGQIDQLASLAAGAQQTLELAPALLGADRPRRYFVLVQQPGESRGTGGLTGGFAIISADHGRLTVTQTGSDADLKNSTIPVPAGVSAEYVYEYGGNLGFMDWQDVNLSPDLPSVATVVAARWKAQGGQDIDGVVFLDPTAIADLLHGSGPVDVGGGRLVRPADMVRYLTVDQYAGIPATADQGLRKDALAGAAAAAAERLNSGAADLGELLRGLSSAVRTGHLRMASNDPALAPGLAASGVDGSLPRGAAPVAYAVVENATQGKLDTFLDRHLTYTAGACRGGTRLSTITVQLRNEAPATGLPPYLTIRIDSGVRTASLDSGVILQTYATRGAQLVSADLDGNPVALLGPTGAGALHAGLEAGLPFWSLFVNLPRDVPQTVTLHLREPVTRGPARVPEQPLVQPLQRTVDVPACG